MNTVSIKSKALLKAHFLFVIFSLMTVNAFGQENEQAVSVNQHSNQEQSKNQNAMDIIQINLEELKKESWSQAELQNAELMTDFVQHVMNNHDFDYIEKNYNNGLYTQHNRNMTEGIAGVIESVKNFTKRYPDFTYDVKHIYVDGDYVTFHSHATLKKKHRGNDKKGLNISDTWKIVDGKIVEHWDSIQPIDFSMRLFVLFNGGKIRNLNGVF